MRGFLVLIIFCFSKTMAIDISSYETHSMLFQAKNLAKRYSGKKMQWYYPYALADPFAVLENASIWFAAYGPSTISCEKESYFSILSKQKLWDYLKDLNIDAIHLGPIKLAGEVENGKILPTHDMGFDPISFELNPAYGTLEEYMNFVKTAKKNQIKIIGDTVPGHTGRGYDFILALKNYQNYPGLYHLIEIQKRDWHFLPKVKKGQLSSPLKANQIRDLYEKKYIVGNVIQNFFFSEGSERSYWEATDVIEGVDGKKRRWVYLHYFKPNQPTLNWLDPSFAANTMIAGDIIDSFDCKHQNILRLDANSFLGIEKRIDSTKAWSEAHPLALSTTNLLGMWIRKLGGFSFQELNLSLQNIKAFSEYGADLSYDFLTRTASYHALLHQNADLLRLTYQEILQNGLQPYQFIHALQNHDELNFDYVHFKESKEKVYFFSNKEINGEDLRKYLLKEDLKKFCKSPYCILDTGPCITLAALCAAALNISDIYHMDKKQKQLVQKAHLLLVSFNAWQPGVFAISGWDLVGALPLSKKIVEMHLPQDKDCRIANRGGYELTTCGCNESPMKAIALYGDLPLQIKEKDSFFSQIKQILKTRKDYHLHLAKLISIPQVTHPQVFFLVHKLLGNEYIQLTAINFGQTPVEEILYLDEIQNTNAMNLSNRKTEKKDVKSNTFKVQLKPLESKAILFEPYRG